MKNEKPMDLNRETAMRLWAKSFGKETKVKDYSGRVIAKGAYNDRSSEFGWNVDHVLPVSRGGTTADYNLVCCHIKTNDEKADKFPCFVANGTRFEIVKVQNHYEIHASKTKSATKPESIIEVDYFDAASGIRYFKKLKDIQNKSRFVASVLIRLTGLPTTAIVDFIENFFDRENISFSYNYGYFHPETSIHVKDYNVATKNDVSLLLDKCVVLNTYFQHFFLPKEEVEMYEIDYRVDFFEEKKEIYLKAHEVVFPNANPLRNSLYINGLVIENTNAIKEIGNYGGSREFQEYDYVFTKLAKDLDKEVNGK